MVFYVCLFVCLFCFVFNGRLKRELISFFFCFVLFCFVFSTNLLFSLLFGIIGLCSVFNYDWLCVLAVGLCVHTSRSCNTTKAFYNPRTASKSDHVTKIIVTLLMKDGFQKCKNSFKANELFFWKIVLFLSYQVIVIPQKIQK